MKTSSSPRSHPRRRLLLFYCAYLVLLGALLFAGAEWLARKRGWRPLEPENFVVDVTPGGKFFQRDSLLGYTHIPGRYVVTLADGYSFRVTHLANTLRATHPVEGDTANARKPEIWIFGCSYTYGWSLDDEDTYPWRVQEAFPEYEVRNFGVNGYAQIHALLRMRRAVEAGFVPKVAVVTYASFHDARNTFLRTWRRSLGTWNRLGPLVQPYARFDERGEVRISYAPVEFASVPLVRRSALANYLELKIEELEQRGERSHEVTRALLLRIAALAREHRFTLVVATVSRDEPTRDILRFAAENGIPAVDISTDLEAPGFRNLPHDRHPSALANREFARRLVAFLSDILQSDAAEASPGQP